MLAEQIEDICLLNVIDHIKAVFCIKLQALTSQKQESLTHNLGEANAVSKWVDDPRTKAMCNIIHDVLGWSGVDIDLHLHHLTAIFLMENVDVLTTSLGAKAHIEALVGDFRVFGIWFDGWPAVSDVHEVALIIDANPRQSVNLLAIYFCAVQASIETLFFGAMDEAQRLIRACASWYMTP